MKSEFWTNFYTSRFLRVKKEVCGRVHKSKKFQEYFARSLGSHLYTLFFYTCLGYLSWRPLIRCLPRYLLRPAFATIKKSKIKFILIKWFYFSRFILLIVYFTIQKLKVKRLDSNPRPKSILFEKIYHFYLHSPHFEFKIMVPPLQNSDSSSNSLNHWVRMKFSAQFLIRQNSCFFNK